MAGYELTILGMDRVISELATLGDGAKALGGRRDSIKSDLPYAYGQNYGRYRSGRLARRAGPTYFFEAGVKAIEDAAIDQLGPAVRNGGAAVRSAWGVLLRRGVVVAQAQAPVKTGSLRRSLHTSSGYGQ
jgi:hypothetical protein